MSWTSMTSCENAVRKSVAAISSASAMRRGQMTSSARSVMAPLRP